MLLYSSNGREVGLFVRKKKIAGVCAVSTSRLADCSEFLTPATTLGMVVKIG